MLSIFSIWYLRRAVKSAAESVRITLQFLASQVQGHPDSLSNITLSSYVNTDIRRTLILRMPVMAGLTATDE